MKTACSVAALLTLAALGACRAPEPPPTDEPPEPQATAAPSHTALRDAMQAPIQKAQGVEAQVQAAADAAKDAADAADAATTGTDVAP